MAFGSLLILFLSVGTHAIWIQERPVLQTRDGHLLISSAKDRNISLLTFGTSAVNINDINLVEVSISARKAARTVETWERGLLGGLLKEVSDISSSLSTIQQRIAGLDFVTDGTVNSSASRPGRPTGDNDGFASRISVGQLTSRVNRIERNLRNIRFKLRENGCAGTPCKHGGTCLRIYDGFQCICPPNWEGPDCTRDFNECVNYAGTDLGCQNGATCTNVPGSYRCTCAQNWYGIHCNTKLNKCEAGDSTELCGHGTCVPKSGNVGYSCICDQGWESDGSDPACRKDVNECTGKHPACSMNPLVPCFNEDGGYRCGGCPAGYTGNGHHCNDVNECSIENGGCSTSPRVDCINTIGSWSCGHCPSGYQGDGVTCTYVGACTINNGGCSPLANCVESSGYVQCNCRVGYHGTGMGPQGCHPGEDIISPCSSNPCVHGTCHPNGDHYVCQCDSQFTGINCESPINPCSPNPCQNGGICRSTDSTTATCNCTSAFSGSRCEVQRQSCSALYKNPSGSLEYPPNGMLYEHGLNCAFVIITNTSMVLNITIIRFDVEKSVNCRFDFLQIHDGKNAGAHQMGRFCGTELPFGGSFTTTHNAVYFWLRTDSTDARRGFAIRWESVPPVCGGSLTGDHGRIASPGSPGKYPHNRDCRWDIFVRPGKRIQFHFYSVMMEEHPTCGYDYLEINETAGNRDIQLGLYCNHTHPPPLVTSSSSATLHFHSDGIGSDTGFQISYSTIEGIPGCGGIFTADHGIVTSPGYPSNYPAHANCDWKIQLPKGEKIRLTWTAFDIERQRNCRFDAVEVFSGPDSESPVVGRYCGNELPASIVMESNVGLIVFTSDRSHQRSGFQLKYETVCGGVFREPMGVLKSPYYPQNYPGSRVCTYEIIEPPGKGIVLTIVDMEIEAPVGRTCFFDGLHIYDGDNENSTVLDSLCGDSGNIPAEPYYSTNNYMYLKFFTDGDAHNRGFLANYTTVDRRCGGLLKEPSGLVRSHAFGDQYSDNEDCTWTLKAPKGHIVQLSFTAFSLEGGMRCNSDYVAVYDTSMKSQEIGRYCGTTLPPVLVTQGGTMTVVFHSDFSVSREGFIAHYVFVDATKICGGHFFTAAGVITSPNYPEQYPPNKECVWIITAPLKQQVILQVNKFDIEGRHECLFDRLEIRNGGSELSPLIGKYCGTNIPRRIKSLTHEIYLKFVTDTSRQMGGFNISWDASTFGCGGVLNGSKGEIVSPGYPQPYTRLASCLWTIAVAAGSKVQLVIVDFDLEDHDRCRYDYIEVTSGADEYRRKGERFCGTNHPSYINMDSNLVTIRFRSDYANNGRGFHIRYETLCHNKVRGFNGVIESPNFPNTYPNYANCTWIIEAPLGNKINLTFSHFELEGRTRDTNCTFDNVTIKEGENDVPNMEHGTFCGTDVPGRLSSTSNQIFVYFNSDRLFGHQGFRLEWIVVGCGGHMTRPNGELASPNYPNAYPENIACEWLIEVDHGHSVEITFLEVNTEKFTGCQFDKVELYAGGDTTGPKIAEFCHSDGPIQFTSSTNKLFVKFLSDASYAGRGFKANYNTVGLECGGNFHASEGFIHSANYPLNYPNNQNCEWLITVDTNHLVNLTFVDFDIEDTANCTDDYVKVFDGASRDNMLLGTFCKNELPPSIISSGNTLLVAMRSDSLVTSKGFKAQFNKACGARIVTDGTGVIETTSLLHMTDDNLNCTWTIIAKDPADHVTLNFFFMEFGNEYDEDLICDSHYVQVYEGDGTDGPSRLRWCSNKLPLAITSNGYALTINLYASYGITDDRFGATYSVLDSTCGGEYLSSSGSFTSPNYPDGYMANATCIWLLKTSPGSRISLTFIDFDMEESPNCDRDYVEIREDSGIGELIGVFCENTPAPIESSKKLWIKFRSDQVGNRVGFRADYTFLHGNELTGTNGEIATPLYPLPWKLKDDISWRITVGFGMAVRVEFDVVRIERMYGGCLSKLTIYDGYDVNAPILATVCGLQPPDDPIISSSNVINLQLTSEWVRDSNLFHLNWYEVPRVTAIDNIQTRTSDCQVVYDMTSIDNHTVTITSPGFPDGYADNLDCTWVVRTIPGSHLSMRFTHMDLEETPNCVNDYAAIYDDNGLATSLDDSKLIAKVCRSNDTNQIFTAKSVMTVKFRSDFYINATGFRALVWRECGGDFSGPDGLIDFNVTKRMHSMRLFTSHCEWNISVRQGKTIKVQFGGFNIENTDPTSCKDNYILLKNGVELESPLLGAGKYCGNRAPTDQLVTTGNKLYVKVVGTSARIDFKISWTEVGMDCGGFYRMDEMVDKTHFNSPNYPNIPPPFSECFWTFLAPAGGRLSLHFIERFDLASTPNCTREYVEVRDGGTEHSTLLGRFCRDVAPSSMTTVGNMLYVHYYSDMPDPKNGFSAAVTTGDVCGGILRGTSGIIRSPNYPATYPINSTCGWWIDGPPGHTLKLEFRDLHLPSLRRCESSDYVSIGQRLPPNNSVHVFGSFCGSRNPGILETVSNEAIISFHSDNRNAVNYRGFVLNYTASREACGGKLSGYSAIFQTTGYPNPNVRSRYCKWIITVPEGARVQLTIIDLDIEGTNDESNHGFDFTLFNDVASKSMITAVHQFPHPKIISSTSRYMTIHFFYTPGHRGLRARFDAVGPVPCGGPEDDVTGTLLPPMAPYNASSFFCQWTLRAPATMLDPHNFTAMTLTVRVSGVIGGYAQQSSTCEYRTKLIRITDGHHDLALLCGNLTGKTMIVMSPAPVNTIDIINGSGTGSMKFDVTYEWMACGGILLGPSDTIRSPENMSYPRSCVWHAKYEDPGAALRLIFNRVNLGSCENGHIIIRNGGPLSPQIGKYCGNIKPGNITSSSNELWIEYWAFVPPGQFEIQLNLVSGSCGGSIRGANREIITPGFPNSYPNDAECIWDIIAVPGHTVGLQFVDRFNLETSVGCTHDFVQLSDWKYDDKGVGTWQEQPKLCGRNRPKIFNATSNRVRVLFRSNNAIQGDGFRAIWEENCGGIFEATGRGQFIESPNYPNDYPSNKICNYTITAPVGHKVWVEFLDFDLEGSRGNCKYDNITITYFQYNQQEEVWCGPRSPSTINSDSKVTIIFKSDAYVSRRGFQLKFFLNECGGNITEPTEISPPSMKNGEYFGSLNCTWIIRAPEGKSVALRFNKFHLEASPYCMYDKVIATDGDSLDKPRLAIICGNVSEGFPVKSKGNVMTVMFQSDATNHYGGMRASVIFTNSIANGCGGTIDLQRSMSFRTQKTALYENFQDCQWSITTEVGKNVRLKIDTINLKNKTNSNRTGCAYGDYLEVRDGAGPFADLIGRYCGNVAPIAAIDSTMNALWIRFYTDGSGIGEGVTATLDPIDSPCGKTVWEIGNTTEIIKSPGYPGDYTAGIQCGWIFKNSDLHMAQLRLHLEEFDMEDSSNCSGDHLDIGDETTKYISQDFGENLIYNGRHRQLRRYGRYSGSRTSTYCGKMDPFDYYSNSNAVHVLLKTTASNLPKPRKFKFVVERATCSRNYTAQQGRIIHEGFEECWTTITTEPNRTISVYFNNFRMDDHDQCAETFFKVHQGDFTTPVIKTLCGPLEPNPIFSIGNKLSFHSKSAIRIYPGIGTYDMTYTTTDKGPGCGGKLFNYEGTITSPMYPASYRNDSMCVWELSVPRGYQIMLQFPLFDLGTSDICSTDFMEITEQNTDGPARYEKYCPGQTPATFRANTNVVTVTYVSSVNNGGTGWIITFATTQNSEIG